MIYVGTSGWSYPKGNGRWDGVFYPDRLADADKLPFYAQYFDTVELNSSFYRPPNENAARAWARKVPETFRFTAKLWQKFTHPRMYEETTGQPSDLRQDDFDVFVRGIAPLADANRLGPLLAQFPASFKPDEGTLEYLADLVRQIRAAGFQLAVELRHRDWTTSDDAQATRDLMQQEGVAWVMIDEPKFKTSIRDVPLTAHQLGYFRFHGRNAAQWWHHDAAEDRYNYLYQPPELQELAADVSAVAAQTQDTYAYYNNHYGAKAVVNALQLKLALHHPAPAEPLPESLLTTFPDLADLLSRETP